MPKYLRSAQPVIVDFVAAEWELARGACVLADGPGDPQLGGSGGLGKR